MDEEDLIVVSDNYREDFILFDDYDYILLIVLSIKVPLNNYHSCGEKGVFSHQIMQTIRTSALVEDVEEKAKTNVALGYKLEVDDQKNGGGKEVDGEAKAEIYGAPEK